MWFWPRMPFMGYDKKHLAEVLDHTRAVIEYDTWITVRLRRFFRFTMWLSFAHLFCTYALSLAMPAFKHTGLYVFLKNMPLPLLCTQLFAGAILFEAGHRRRIWAAYALLRHQQWRNTQARGVHGMGD